MQVNFFSLQTLGCTAVSAGDKKGFLKGVISVQSKKEYFQIWRQQQSSSSQELLCLMLSKVVERGDEENPLEYGLMLLSTT